MRRFKLLLVGLLVLGALVPAVALAASSPTVTTGKPTNITRNSAVLTGAVNPNGVATGFIVAPDVSLDGIRSVLQRSVLLHRDASDPYAWPQHGAGVPLACGVTRTFGIVHNG